MKQQKIQYKQYKNRVQTKQNIVKQYKTQLNIKKQVKQYKTQLNNAKDITNNTKHS